MRPREIGLVALSIIAAVVCLRLGFWQLSRLHERQASNAVVASRLDASPVTVAQLSRDSAQLRYRRVLVNGAYDYAHQVVLTTRTRNGSPGVNVLTPVHVAGSDTALLVNRGWLYAPDGVRTDLTPWGEGDSVHAIAYVVPAERIGNGTGDAQLPSREHAYRWVDTAALKTSIPYPVFPFVAVLNGDSTNNPKIMPRIPPPPLDEGPHLSYALQWFSFAIIAVVGMALFIMRVRRNKNDFI